jgi:hypothetical protein
MPCLSEMTFFDRQMSLSRFVAVKLEVVAESIKRSKTR